MTKPKPKLKRSVRSRARKGAGMPPKPAAKKKKVSLQVKVSRKEKPKASAPAGGTHPRGTAAVPRPELEKIPTRPLFDAPRHSYFLGGGTAMPEGFLPDGFVLVSARKPADYFAAEFRIYRTFPEGRFVRCVRYELKPECVAQVRQHVSDLGGTEMAFIEAGNFFYQNGKDGPELSVRCPCNQNLWRVGKSGSVRCSKCGRTHTAPTDRTGLPIMNSQALKDYFSYDAAKLPRDRTR